jgi:hypothetical protein
MEHTVEGRKECGRHQRGTNCWCHSGISSPYGTCSMIFSYSLKWTIHSFGNWLLAGNTARLSLLMKCFFSWALHSLGPGKEFGKRWHRRSVVSFYGHNRCWTAGRLARHGLPHPEVCPFCDRGMVCLTG